MITLRKTRNPGVRIVHAHYGLGTVIRPEGQFKVVVKFDRSDSFHGHAPVIMMAYELDEA